MKKALVIGASGNLAQGIAHELSKSGYEVHGVSRSPQVGTSPFSARHEKEKSEWKSLEGVEIICFLAAHLPYGSLGEKSSIYNEINCEYLYPALQSYPDGRFIFASSVSVYGEGERETVLTENSPVRNLSAYATAKLVGEGLVSNHCNAVSIRLSSLYGPGMAKNSLLPIWVDAARRGEDLTVYGEGSRTQDYLHFSDAAKLFLAAANSHYSGVVNGVSGAPVSNRELGELLAAAAQVNLKFQGVDIAPSRQYCGQRAKQELGWKPAVTLKTGVESLINV